MSSNPGTPTAPVPPPASTPLTPRAKAVLLPALGELSKAISTKDDDTPANKIRFTMEFLNKAAARLGITTDPIPGPDFTKASSSAPASTAGPALTRAATAAAASVASSSSLASLAAPSPQPATLPPGNPSYSATISKIINKYNPTGKELTHSPPPEAFAAVAAAKVSRASAASAPAAPAAPLPAQIALTHNLPSAQVQALRAAFQAALTENRFPWTKNNSITMASFTAEEVKSITRIIFDDVFNLQGHRRALAVITSYRKSEDRTNPISSTVIAARLALDANLPLDVRQFYSVYSASTKSSTRLSAVEQMLVFHEKYKLYNSYLRLLSQPSEHLRDLLRKAGYVPRQGQGWATIMLRYIAGQLELEKSKLRNILQETQCMHLMVATFGVGVLAFVPRRIINFLQRMGVQKCQQIFRTASDVGLLPALKPLCDRACQTIVNPVLHGQTLPLLQIEVPENAPQTLLDAMTYSRAADEPDVDMEDPEDFLPIEDDNQILYSDEEFEGFPSDTEMEESGEGESGEGESGEEESGEEESEDDPFL